MNGTADVPGEGKNVPGEAKNVVSVFLTCISCGKVEEIHVFRERRLPRKVYWDCHDCQKNGKANINPESKKTPERGRPEKR
jgi:hypothetical protein